MKNLAIVHLGALFTLTLCVTAARGSTISHQGTLSSPEASVEFVITLATAGTVNLQTYGFGGGTNAAGAVIAPGGTDPFLAVFSGTSSGAAILTDGSGNPYGTSLDLSNYENPDFGGCGPANTESIAGAPLCGDISMTLPALDIGTYTVLLSDGQYIANAVFSNGILGDGFTDLTGGVFCNVVVDNNGDACPNNSGAWALDITTPGASSAPEPAALVTASLGLLGLAVFGALTNKRRTTKSGKEDLKNELDS